MNKKIKISLIILAISILLLFSSFSVYFYAHFLGKMSFSDIFHFWEFISDQNSDWDTFSFLISGTLGCTFSGISLIILITEHFDNINDQNKIEQNKLTVRYVQDMQRLNDELRSLKNGAILSTIYKELNINIQKYIYIWILLEDLDKSNFRNANNYKELSTSFPIVTNAFSDTFQKITWDDFIKHRQLPSLYNCLTKIPINKKIQSEILENVGHLYSLEKWLEINKSAISEIVFKNQSPILKDIYKRIINSFFYAMKSFENNQDGLNYYFLQLSDEQRYFFMFVTMNEKFISKIITAINETSVNILNNDKNQYSILNFLGKKI